MYPDVRIGFEAVRDRLDIYLNLEGGNRITSWSDFLSRNRFFNPYTYGTDFLGNTVERVRAEIGIAGNIASRLAYDLRAGYVHYANAFLDGVTSDPAFGLVYTPDYAAYQMFHATLDLGWESKAFSADGSFTWRHTDVLDRTGGLFAPHSEIARSISSTTGTAAYMQEWTAVLPLPARGRWLSSAMSGIPYCLR